jgi:GNAT superfamily N-acetyltransferase
MAMTIRFTLATPADVEPVVRLRAAVAQDLTQRHGRGHWSSVGTDRSVLRDIRTSQVILGWRGAEAVATSRLSSKRPWAIDAAYFTPVARPLYLTDMAVDPQWQGRGIGRRCLERTKEVAAESGAEAIRLDAYEGPPGAGPFYAGCGFTERGRTSYRMTRLIYYEWLFQPARR